MKILFFIESLHPGGKERRLVELLIGLKKYKDIHFELVITKSEIHYTKVQDLNIPIYIIERKGLKKDPRLFYHFYKIVKKVRPNIIHVWGNMAAIYAIPTKILLNIPMINNQITAAPAVLSKKTILLYKFSYLFSELLIANSKAGLKAFSAPEKKSMVIYNGFNFNRLNNLVSKDIIRKTFKINTDFVIGMVASFSKYKDYETYIKAAILVLESVDYVTFLCVGAGQKQIYQEMVPDKYKNNILFLGPQDNVESIMNICDIGVLASNHEVHGEGISNALLEFMALGKPVIATNGGGTPELVVANDTGFLVKPKSIQQLADKILQLVFDDDLRYSMGEKSRVRITNKFSISSMIENFAKVYYSYFNQ